MVQKSGDENQLRLVGLVVYPTILQGLIIYQGGCLGFLNHQQYHFDRGCNTTQIWRDEINYICILYIYVLC